LGEKKKKRKKEKRKWKGGMLLVAESGERDLFLFPTSFPHSTARFWIGD
jgi:hypothetical protein